MRNLRVLLTVLLMGWAAGMLLSDVEGSAESGKKGKTPPPTKAPTKAKAPKAAKPSVHTKVNTKVKPAGSKQPEAQKTSDQQLVQAFRVLQSVHKTLKMADHDYGGHRSEAMNDISKAEHQLQHALQHQGQKAPKGGTTAAPAWHPEPQKLSNAQLAAAIPTLQKTITVLEKANHDYGGHRGKALADLHQATTQLQKALRHVKK